MCYVILILIPTTEGRDPLSQTQRWTHEACAISAFMLFLAAESHTLFCSDLIVRMSDGKERRLYPMKHISSSERQAPPAEHLQQNKVLSSMSVKNKGLSPDSECSVLLHAHSVLEEQDSGDYYSKCWSVIDVRRVVHFFRRVVRFSCARCSCWPSDVFQTVNNLQSNLRSSVISVGEFSINGGSPGTPSKDVISKATEVDGCAVLHECENCGILDGCEGSVRVDHCSQLETPLLASGGEDARMQSGQLQSVAVEVAVEKEVCDEAGARFGAAYSNMIIPEHEDEDEAVARIDDDETLYDIDKGVADEDAEELAKRSPGPQFFASYKGFDDAEQFDAFVFESRSFRMFEPERSGRLTAVLLSFTSFTLFFFVQVLWALEIRAPSLSMLSFMFEMFGVLFTFTGLANIWYYAKPLQSSRQWGRYNPADSAQTFKRALDSVALTAVGLMVAHFYVLYRFWSPAIAVSNCLDASCETCLPGTDHDGNVQTDGWRACDTLTSDALFWTTKLGSACFCDSRPENGLVQAETYLRDAWEKYRTMSSSEIGGVDEAAMRSFGNAVFNSTGASGNSKEVDQRLGSEVATSTIYPFANNNATYAAASGDSMMGRGTNNLDKAGLDSTTTDLSAAPLSHERSEALGGSRCRPPAYPYLVDVAPATMPFSLIRLEGCQIDDVRRLRDPSLAYLDTDGNPVADFAAKGIACALLSRKYQKTGQLSCGVGVPASELMVYCADDLGRPLSAFSPDIEQVCRGTTIRETSDL
ncbi:unnamed protein product [Amoebophrya sp. A25]|nr:unnamed protein product [Amoebophrya sp. A25]|eukprot:GSA25T00001781001.1